MALKLDRETLIYVQHILSLLKSFGESDVLIIIGGHSSSAQAAVQLSMSLMIPQKALFYFPDLKNN